MSSSVFVSNCSYLYIKTQVTELGTGLYYMIAILQIS